MTPETRVVFIGSAELACPSLEKLHVTPRLKVVGVVTQPERPSGRALRPAACPIHVCAVRLGIPTLTPEKINTPTSLEALHALRPDVIAVVAYGQILRSAILDLPPLGCINLHASLLPSYRGAAPIQWAIARGETVTGVTTMFMNEGLDTGDIIFQEAEPIHPEDTSATLHDRLACRGADLLVRTLYAVRAGTAPRRSQDSVGVATFAPRLKKADGGWIGGCRRWSYVIVCADFIPGRVASCRCALAECPVCESAASSGRAGCAVGAARVQCCRRLGMGH